jgi:hypothetical protein
MSIKQLGGVFGRNPTFNDVTIEGELTFDGDIDINSDLKIDGDLEVIGTSTLAGLNATTGGFSGNVIVGDYTSTDIRLSEIRTNKAIFSIFTDGATNGNGTTIGYSWANGGQGPLKFNNAAGEVARFTTNGNLAFVSGKGIDFSATAGTGTSELLDDYEEGTWTPAFAFDIGGTGIVYGTRSGKYTKIGNTVCVDFQLNVASGISVADYFVRLSGIPFNCANDGLNIGRVWIQNPNSASFNLSVQGGSDSLICFTDNAASGAGSYARGDDVVGVTISGSFTYRTS